MITTLPPHRPVMVGDWNYERGGPRAQLKAVVSIAV